MKPGMLGFFFPAPAAQLGEPEICEAQLRSGERPTWMAGQTGTPGMV